MDYITKLVCLVLHVHESEKSRPNSAMTSMLVTHFGEEMCPIVAVEMSMRLGLQAIRRGNKFRRRNLVTAKTYFLAFGNE